MNIVFPELNHPHIQAAIATYNTDHAPITPLAAADLDAACELVNSGAADALIAGIDYASRDVILACRAHFSMGNYHNLINHAASSYTTFSGLAVMQRDAELYLLADMAACKHPTGAQLVEIVHQTYASAQRLLTDQPRLALLSFSTAGSGGHDDTITLMQSVRDYFRNSVQSQDNDSQNPNLQPTHSTPANAASTPILIDGEMQLDAAIVPEIGQKKFPGSSVAGRANVFIAPDLNTGNTLYKAFEHLAGFHVAGPILQGFSHPVSDLSRGSSVADIVLTIDSIVKLASKD